MARLSAIHIWVVNRDVKSGPTIGDSSRVDTKQSSPTFIELGLAATDLAVHNNSPTLLKLFLCNVKGDFSSFTGRRHGEIDWMIKEKAGKWVSLDRFEKKVTISVGCFVSFRLEFW